MGTFIAMIFFFLCFLIICIILLQEGKGGGLAATGGAAMDNVIGGSSNPLRRWTAWFFAFFVVLTITINMRASNSSSTQKLTNKDGEKSVLPLDLIDPKHSDDNVISNNGLNDLLERPTQDIEVPPLPTDSSGSDAITTPSAVSELIESVSLPGLHSVPDTAESLTTSPAIQ